MTPETIGKHHPRLKEIRKSIARKSLTDDGLLPVEGPTLIEEAHRSGVEIVELFLEQHTAYTPPGSSRTYTLSPQVFRSIRATRNSQGAIALIRPRTFTLDDILETDPQVVVVLCRIQDPGNAGTILRVAEAFGAAGCLATVGTVSLYNDKLARASAGSLFRLPHCWGLDLGALAQRLRSAGIHLVGTATDAAQPVHDYAWKQPAAILFGNESGGLSTTERDLCDELFRIPHQDAVESLNAAVAAGIVLYEAARGRAVEANDHGFTV
jgi:TrmH family RNA methyltransferase